MTPIYLPENCQSAFQLNWSVAVFGQLDFPPKETWYDSLKLVSETDGVRILEVHIPQPRVVQFFVSTRPSIVTQGRSHATYPGLWYTTPLA